MVVGVHTNNQKKIMQIENKLKIPTDRMHASRLAIYSHGLGFELDRSTVKQPGTSGFQVVRNLNHSAKLIPLLK